MNKFKSDFLNVLNQRGFIHQCSDESGIDQLAVKGELVAYAGYDATAPSLHIGHLTTIMMLHWLQETGAGKPIALTGGVNQRQIAWFIQHRRIRTGIWRQEQVLDRAGDVLGKAGADKTAGGQRVAGADQAHGLAGVDHLAAFGDMQGSEQGMLHEMSRII